MRLASLHFAQKKNFIVHFQLERALVQNNVRGIILKKILLRVKMQFLQSKSFTQKAKDYLTMESLRKK